VLRENARLLGPEEEASIDELSRQHQELRRDWTPIFTMFLEGKASEAKDRIAAEMVSRSDDFVDALATEVMRHRLAFNLAIGDYRDSRDIWQASALTVGGLWMVLLLSTAYLSHRWIVRPLGDVARSARLIAAGELHSVAPVGGPAEIAGLAGDVNLMARSLINRSRELNEYLAQGLEARTRELEAANAALKTSEARLNAVIENAPVILFALDKDEVVTFSAGAGLALTGLTPDSTIGFSVRDLFADDRAALDAFRRAFAGETVRVDIRYSSFCFETHLAPLKDGEGDVVGVIGVALDVTARMAVEEALRRSEERYRELFENANDLVFTHAVEGGFTSANRAALDLFGYSEEEILNMRMEDLLSPDMLERARANLALKLEGAEDRTIYEIEVRT
jgi:PAS domain S-box-containing protein